MYFEDEDSFEKRPEFQKYVVELVMGSRGSKMRDESAKEIKFYMAENATKDEKTLFGDLVPMIVKKARGSEPTLKRDVVGEIKTQAETFWATDNLDKRTDCQFLKNALPRRIQSTGTTLGLSEPKPDWVYGLKRPLRPELTLPTVSEAAKALIEVAPGLQHAWFAVENKGAEDSIESAETQAIRSGAALVSAQRQLAILAGLLDPAAESIGADQERFAFTCSWVPQLAKIHVHWHEKRANEVSIYHMNLIRGYLMIDKTHLSDFRKDIHNVLDYGVSRTRKEKLMELTVAIAKVEAERSPKKQVGEGSTTNESAGS